MSGHTNRNKRSGGNSKSRHGPPRPRGGDGRGGQPKNATPPAAQEPRVREQPEQKPTRDIREENKPRRLSQPPAPNIEQPPSTPDAALSEQQPPDTEAASERDTETTAPAERPEPPNPRGRTSFAAASRGGHAYIPASGPRQTIHGQNGQNGHHRGGNGHLPAERRLEPTSASFTGDYDGGESDGADAIPTSWRIERLNGGTDTTPREPFRPESRGEVGPLIDSLHELFAQDRAVASQGDSARCGICYLHFPLTALEYREAEGFYVCVGCKRALGHNPLMMIRRQQPPHSG